MFKKRIKDTDYLFISARIRAMERNLLTAARMERMIDAPSAEEAGKVLQEIGYGEFSAESDRELSAALAAEREKLAGYQKTLSNIEETIATLFKA